MQFEDKQAITPYLLPTEKIHWTGRPPTGILFRKSYAILVLSSLLWGGFGTYWYGVYRSGFGSPSFLFLFGLVLVLIGLFYIIWPFLNDIQIRKNTIYALTNERILILSGLFGKSMKAMNLKNLPQISLELFENGRGTISFGTSSGSGFSINNHSWPGSNRTSPPMFEKIENASEVYRLIQSAVKQ